MKTMEGLHLIDGRSCCLCQRRVRFICIFNVCFFFVSGVSASYGSDMFFSSMLAVWPLALACYERYIYIYRLQHAFVEGVWSGVSAFRIQDLTDNHFADMLLADERDSNK